MSQYKTGTVSVTNGSQVVTGNGTSWLSNVQPGDGFVLVGVPVPYTVSSVDSDTQLKLSASWSGSPTSGAKYAIFRDFTSEYNLPELSQGDIETATIWTRALRLIDQLQAASLVTHLNAADPHSQYLLDADYQKDLLRESLLKEATLNLDFANNRYEVYEGPVDGLTARPFNDVLDFTRSSAASARNATGGISNVLADQQRLVGNREGLLIEEQRTNLLLRGEAFNDGSWSKGSGITVTPDATTAPDGEGNADRINEGSDTQSKTLFAAASVSASTDYTRSIFVKPDGRKWIYIQHFDGANNLGAWFDIEAGVIGTVQNGRKAFIDGPFADGWYRCSVKNTTTASTTTERLQVSLATADGGSSNYTGDGTSGIYIWGAQLEQGSFPTSYIKTDGSQVTRSADNCSRALGQEFNPDRGTFFIEASLDFIKSNVSYLMDNRVNGSGPALFIQSGELRGVVRSLGNVEVIIGSGHFPEAGGIIKAAVSWDENTFRIYGNGVGAEGLRIGTDIENPKLRLFENDGATVKESGLFKKALFTPRALTETELEALTS